MNRFNYLFDRKPSWLDVCRVFYEILRRFIIESNDGFILRLKKTTKLLYRGKDLKVSEIAKKVTLFMELFATKVKKNKRVKKQYMCGAVKVKYQIGNQVYGLWLVVAKNKGGGFCYLLLFPMSTKQLLQAVIQ